METHGSERRERIYQFIAAYIDENAMSPSIREIMAACDVSSSSVVNYHLRRLEADGRIVRTPVISRSIRVVV